MLSREERIENYYDNCSIQELAEWMVDAEDAYTRRGDMLTELEYKLRLLRIERDAYQERSERLAQLEAAGVDNWEGYSNAGTEHR